MTERVRALIINVIKANGNREITGDILQDVLLEMLTTVEVVANEGNADAHWHDNKNVLDGITAEQIDAIVNLSNWWKLDEENDAIYSEKSVYSLKGVSALGLGEDGESGGDYDRLDRWEDYDSSKAGWVLSALLGKDLDTRVGDNSSSISDLNQRVDAIGDSDKNFVHTQGVPSDTWTITHSLNKYPSVTIIDSGGTEVIGNIKYIDSSTVSITFSSEFSGKAILN